MPTSVNLPFHSCKCIEDYRLFFPFLFVAALATLTVTLGWVVGATGRALTLPTLFNEDLKVLCLKIMLNHLAAPFPR